ncbi:MAG: cupin domain-containing protein [Thermoplasmatota archaeon]
MAKDDVLVIDSDDIEKEKVEKGQKVFIQKLIVDEQNAENCYLRKFTMEPGAKMGMHLHDNGEHVQYFLKGKMILKTKSEEYEVEEGNAMHISTNTSHSYENPFEEDAVFLCVVPAHSLHTDMDE